MAAILIHQIGDGWIATAAIGSVAVLAILAFLGAMLALLRVTPKKRFFFSIAVAVLAAPFLPLQGALEAFLFAAAALVLLSAGILDVLALARGELNADAAQARIRELLNEKRRKDPIGLGLRYLVPMPDEDKPLFDLLYPYRWAKRKRGQGTEQTGNLAQTVARLLAELGDSDEPPFFKNLLRVDLRDLPEADADGPDRELRVRCLGVTGFAQEERDGAPVEDELRIRFRSASRFKAWLKDTGRSPRCNA